MGIKSVSRWAIAGLAAALLLTPAAGAQSRDGVSGEHVGSGDWFRSMRQGAANQSLLRSLGPGAAKHPDQIPAGYMEVAGKINFAGGANPFPGGSLPELRIAAIEREKDEIERAPSVADDGTFYTVLRQGVSYRVIWKYPLGGAESWDRIEVPPNGPRQGSVELIYGVPVFAAAPLPDPSVAFGPRAVPAMPASSAPSATPPDHRLSKGAYRQLTLGGRKAIEIKTGMVGSSYDTYRLDVPPGLARLEVSVVAHGEDLDLAIKAGSEIASYLERGGCDFRDFSSEPNPSCVLDNPAPGPLYIDVVNLGSAGAGYTLRAASTKAKTTG